MATFVCRPRITYPPVRNFTWVIYDKSDHLKYESDKFEIYHDVAHRHDVLDFDGHGTLTISNLTSADDGLMVECTATSIAAEMKQLRQS